MTPAEKLRATSCESLLACLRDRLFGWTDEMNDTVGQTDKDHRRIVRLQKDMLEVAARIDMKLRMERGE